MGSSTAVCLGLVVESSILVGCQDHFTVSISYAIVGVCRNMVNYQVDGRCGSLRLLGANIVQAYKESVVDCPGIIQKRAYNILYAFYTFIVEFGACVFFCH